MVDPLILLDSNECQCNILRTFDLQYAADQCNYHACRLLQPSVLLGMALLGTVQQEGPWHHQLD